VAAVLLVVMVAVLLDWASSLVGIAMFTGCSPLLNEVTSCTTSEADCCMCYHDNTTHKNKGESPDQTGPDVVYIVVISHELVLTMSVTMDISP